MFLYAESPVHWGTGTSVGVVDLPIQRERHTDYPTGQSSGIKGALRAWFEQRPNPRKSLITAAFGPDSQASDHAGCVAFGDARLVLFPVRSLRGTFAYCTSRFLLARLDRDLVLAGDGSSLLEGFPDPDESEGAFVATKSPLLNHGRVVLEEYPVAAAEADAVALIGKRLGDLAAPSVPPGFWAARIASHLCVLPQDVLRDLVRMATTIETHVRIDNETGTADDKGLFYEELLPSDAVLYSPLYVSAPLLPASGKPDDWPDAAAVRNLIGSLNDQRVQMGAGSTSGRGIVLCRLFTGGTADA